MGYLLMVLVLTLAAVAAQTVHDEPTTVKNEDTTIYFVETTTAPISDTTIHEEEVTPLSSNQAAVLKELNEIWDYSSALNESTDGELKTTLSSVVQLAYARLHAEPDDTLHRLKYLLEKLRQRIGVSHRHTVIHIKGKGSDDIDDDNGRSRGSQPSGTDYAEKTVPVNHGRVDRRKRSYGIGHVERFEDNSVVLSNSLSYVKNRPTLDYGRPAPTVTPSEATVHKVLLFYPQRPTQPPRSTTTQGSQGTTNQWGLWQPTVFHPPVKIVSQLAEDSSTENDIGSSSQDGDVPQSAPSVEHIANAIVKLLYPLQDPTDYPQVSAPQEFSFPDHKYLFEDKLALIKRPSDPTTTPSSVLTTVPPTGTSSVSVTNMSMETTTKPPLFQVLHASSNAMNGTETASNKVGILKSEADSDREESILAPSSTQASIQAIQIMDELQTSNILKAPSIFLNGTRDGFAHFITTLSTLSFTTKMVIVFALSISILSIVLGVYSLGPPIIAVGILGVMIPISILLLLQDGGGKVNRNQMNSSAAHGKITFNDQISAILDLMDDAVRKYAELSNS